MYVYIHVYMYIHMHIHTHTCVSSCKQEKGSLLALELRDESTLRFNNESLRVQMPKFQLGVFDAPAASSGGTGDGLYYLLICVV